MLTAQDTEALKAGCKFPKNKIMAGDLVTPRQGRARLIQKRNLSLSDWPALPRERKNLQVFQCSAKIFRMTSTGCIRFALINISLWTIVLFSSGASL